VGASGSDGAMPPVVCAGDYATTVPNQGGGASVAQAMPISILGPSLQRLGIADSPQGVSRLNHRSIGIEVDLYKVLQSCVRQMFLF